MQNVTPQVAQLGWELYRRSVPRPSRDQVNADLAGQGHAQISIRTFRHYQNLERHGYSEYIPINELDVRVKLARLRRAG
jgi:hypothetical protein